MDRDFTHATDVPISTPVLYSEWELVDMNGFAFTQVAGIVIQRAPVEEDWRFRLRP